ncbi:hypothetical protein BGZ76_005528 [Entomortierella beljakovae]|nr:hypothetical protein BGZ76_005528 [Entomortierella beljakovae]
MAGHNICNIVRGHLLEQQRPEYLQPVDENGNYPWKYKPNAPCGTIGSSSGTVGSSGTNFTMTNNITVTINLKDLSEEQHSAIMSLLNTFRDSATLEQNPSDTRPNEHNQEPLHTDTVASKICPIPFVTVNNNKL